MPIPFFVDCLILNNALSDEINSSFLVVASFGYEAIPKLALILAGFASDFN
jgi:hypothetical protein